MPEMMDRPPAFAGESTCWLPRSRRSPGIARRLLVGLLAEVEGGHRFLDPGLLLISELVTNAILVKALSLRWGCCPRDHAGKIVWCECGPAVEDAAVVS